MAKKKAKTARKLKAAPLLALDAGPIGNLVIKKATLITPVALKPYTVIYKVI